MNKLKIAVIGAGRLGGFHAQKLAKHPEVRLVAVVDPVEAARQRVAADCGAQTADDYRPLLEHLDAAVIATPTLLHHEVALDLLRGGVHVLVEKPLCATRAEADELIEVARSNRLVLQVGHVERFNPAFAAVAPQIRNPKYVEAVRAGGFTFRSTDIGVVLDLMIHDIDLVLSLVRSPVRRVDALGISVLGAHEDVANARLEFASGCVAALSASRVSYESVRRMQLWSAQAFAGIDFAARTATLVRPSETLLRRELDVERLSPEQLDHYRQHLADEHLPREHMELRAVDALALELDDFVAAIRTGRAPRVGGESGRDAVAVAEMILARIRTHAWDGLPEGPIGPLAATPGHRHVPAPHFDLSRIGAEAPEPYYGA